MTLFPEFWKEGCEATARHALNLLRLAEEPITAANVLALIHSAQRSDAEVSDLERRRRSFCRKCLDIAYERMVDQAAPQDQPAWDAAEFHFLVTMPALSAGTRKLLEDTFAGIVRGFNLGELRTAPVTEAASAGNREGAGHDA